MRFEQWEKFRFAPHGSEGDGGHRRVGGALERIRAIGHQDLHRLHVAFVLRCRYFVLYGSVQGPMRPAGAGKHVGAGTPFEQELDHLILTFETGVHQGLPGLRQLAIVAKKFARFIQISLPGSERELPALLIGRHASYAQSMTDETDLITVYRSADSNAEQDANAILDLLLKGGFNAVVLGDKAPEVLEGTFEVKVPRAEGEAAEALIGQRATADDPEPIDASHDLDLVTVASTDGTTGEMEAMAIQSVLDAN